MGSRRKTEIERIRCIKMPEYEVFIDDKPKKIDVTRTQENCFAVKVNGKPVSVELQRNENDFEKPFIIKMDNKTYCVEMPQIENEKSFLIKIEGVLFKAEIRNPVRKAAITTFNPVVATPARKTAADRRVEEGAVVAPMTGRIVSVRVRKGEQVKAGQPLCVIEAMKMENEIVAPKPGLIKEIYISEGSSVSEGEALLILA